MLNNEDIKIKEPNPAKGGKGTDIQAAIGGPEDIFADVVKEKNFVDRLPVKKVGDLTEEDLGYSNSYRNRFLINLAVMASVLLVVLLIIWMSYSKLIKEPQDNIFLSSTNKEKIPLANIDNDKKVEIGQSEKNITNIKKDDTDGDGLSDEEEGSLGMNVLKPDTDGDGLFDRDEVKVYKTDPLKPDTDGDGVNDGDEVRTGDNPKGQGKLYDMTRRFVAPGPDASQASATDDIGENIDTDGDGISDHDEINIYKTDPNKFDTDGDTYDDGTEIKKGFNPLVK